MSQPRRIDPNPERSRMFDRVHTAPHRDVRSKSADVSVGEKPEAGSGLPAARFTDEGIVVGDTLIPGSALGSDVVLVNLSKSIKRLDVSLFVSDVDLDELPETVNLTVRGRPKPMSPGGFIAEPAMPTVEQDEWAGSPVVSAAAVDSIVADVKKRFRAGGIL